MKPKKAEQEATARLRALDAALDAFADEIGLDAGAMRHWVGSREPDKEPLTEAEQAE